MKTIIILGLCCVLTQAFIEEKGNGLGPDGKPLPTEKPYTTRIIPTPPNLPCRFGLTEKVKAVCENIKIKNFKTIHPDDDHWFIFCNEEASRCQRCSGDLVFNTNCQMCLKRGADCPAPTKAPVLRACPDDGCPFCSTLYGYEAHSNVLNYCRCVHGIGYCMLCPTGTIFDAKYKCCMTSLAE
eukprot:TCONS_00067728-protein